MNQVLILIFLTLYSSGLFASGDCDFFYDLSNSPFGQNHTPRRYKVRVGKGVTNILETEAAALEKYKQKTSEISSGIKALSSTKKGISNGILFYPASGTDSYTGFFLGAKKIIAMDNNPFFKEIPSKGTLNIQARDNYGTIKMGWRQYGTIAEEGHVGERIIGNLKAFYPGSQNFQVEIYESKEYLDKRKGQKAIHGRIIFQTASGETLEYIHINAHPKNGLTYARASKELWFQFLIKSDIQSALIKGSNSGMFTPFGDGKNLTQYQYVPAIRHLILKKVESVEGYVIEGYGGHRYSDWEFTTDELEAKNYPTWVRFPRHPGQRVTSPTEFFATAKAGSANFGYSQGVRVTKFKRK